MAACWLIWNSPLRLSFVGWTAEWEKNAMTMILGRAEAIASWGCREEESGGGKQVGFKFSQIILFQLRLHLIILTRLFPSFSIFIWQFWQIGQNMTYSKWDCSLLQGVERSRGGQKKNGVKGKSGKVEFIVFYLPAYLQQLFFQHIFLLARLLSYFFRDAGTIQGEGGMRWQVLKHPNDIWSYWSLSAIPNSLISTFFQVSWA